MGWPLIGHMSPVSFIFFNSVDFFFTETAFWQVMALTGKPFEHLELPQVGGRNGWLKLFFFFVLFAPPPRVLRSLVFVPSFIYLCICSRIYILIPGM